MSSEREKKPSKRELPKCPTGIVGLDQITEGGLPRGRPTLICGGAGCGKTVLAMEFLVRGATQYHEPGVFIAFEETEKELGENVTSMGFELAALCAQRKLFVDHVHVERSEIRETGEYDLEGLFIRLQNAIQTVGAKRVVLDSLEALFSGFTDANILRSEFRRLFRWLKDRGITAVVTAESGEGKMTRSGIEEYVADCVIFLDHRVADQSSIRRLRVMKYRGSLHGTNEYPFLIGSDGISVLPITSLKLDYKASLERISSGIPRLDAMLGGKGFYRGSSILISGTAGTGKSTLAAHFVSAACQRGERALYLASEQSAPEMVRNMRSVGLDLGTWTKRGLLHFYNARSGTFGLEKHLVEIHDIVTRFAPRVAVIDPITTFAAVGNALEVKAMLTRLLDIFKTRQITTLFTSLTPEGDPLLQVEVGVSSLVDAWLLLRNLESNGERNRGLYVLKARGTAHSNQIREFLITDHGVQLRDVYVGPEGVLTGSARLTQEARERAAAAERHEQLRRKERELKQKRTQLETQIANLRAQFEEEEGELVRATRGLASQDALLASGRIAMGRARQADVLVTPRNGHQEARH